METICALNWHIDTFIIINTEEKSIKNKNLNRIKKIAKYILTAYTTMILLFTQINIPIEISNWAKEEKRKKRMESNKFCFTVYTGLAN